MAEPNFIVSVSWLKEQLDAHAPEVSVNAPPAAEDEEDRLVILEASWSPTGDAKEYHAGHIPTAVHFNTDDFETGWPKWMLRPMADLREVIGRYGITRHTPVVVYGGQTIAVARVWWILTYAGANARMLNGGIHTWQQAGYAVERIVRKPRGGAKFVGPDRRWMVANQEHVMSRLRRRHDFQHHTKIVDVRSQAEFNGEVSGYSYMDMRGRIPGAIFAQDADDTACVYQNEDGTLLDPQVIYRLWRTDGVLSVDDNGDATVDQELIFYCGTGWRSSLTCLYAHELFGTYGLGMRKKSKRKRASQRLSLPSPSAPLASPTSTDSGSVTVVEDEQKTDTEHKAGLGEEEEEEEEEKKKKEEPQTAARSSSKAKGKTRVRIRNYSDGWLDWSTIHEYAPEYKGGSTPGWRQLWTGNPVDGKYAHRGVVTLNSHAGSGHGV